MQQINENNQKQHLSHYENDWRNEQKTKNNATKRKFREFTKIFKKLHFYLYWIKFIININDFDRSIQSFYRKMTNKYKWFWLFNTIILSKCRKWILITSFRCEKKICRNLQTISILSFESRKEKIAFELKL